MQNVTYEQLIQRCQDLQTISLEDKNEREQKLYSTIYNLLTSVNVFKQLSAEACLNILVDLQYTWEESKEIYNQLFVK